MANTERYDMLEVKVRRLRKCRSFKHRCSIRKKKNYNICIIFCVK